MEKARIFFPFALLLFVVKNCEVRFLLLKVEDKEIEAPKALVFAADIDRNAIMDDGKCKWEITYGECTKSCGGGTQIKHKKKVPVDGFDGKCVGYDTEEEECNVEPCPENCVWGEWKEGICSKTCGGGSRTDERTKIKPEQNGGTCEGKTTRVVDCNPQKCPVNCIWGDWVKGTCSKTCGGGRRTDERTITKPEENGGTCEGKPTRVVDCNKQKCPLTGIPCCIAKGVGARCLGKCLGPESTNLSQRRSFFAGADGCTKYEKIAAECRDILCPIGYGFQTGDKVGHQFEIQSKKALNIRSCGQLCDENMKCLSIEWSESDRTCNLLTAATTDGPAYYDYRFCSKICPNGYHFQTGDKFGNQAQIQSKEAQNVRYCGKRCNDDEKCRSIEWSESEKKCVLLTAEITDGPAYNDFQFCSKSCPNGYRFQLGDRVGDDSTIKWFGAENIWNCAKVCDANKECRSIEWGNSERNCTLLSASSADGPKWKDYIFCSKTEEIPAA